MLRLPGLKVEDVLKRVRAGVVQRTSGAQTRWDASSLIGDFYFVAPPRAAAAAPVAAPTPSPMAAATAPVSPPRAPPPADGVWSLFMQCSGLVGWTHTLLGRRVTDGRLVGRSPAHDSPERWELDFALPTAEHLEIAGTLTDARGKSGRYTASAIGSGAAFRGTGKFGDYDCGFEARRIQ